MSQTVKKVIIGNDQGAVDLKFRLMKALEERGIDVENCGIDSEESIDYPDMAQDVCGRFLKGDYDLGILCCGTGIGISISANKIKGIRCALLYDTYSAEMARNHNDANFIAFGEGYITMNR